VQTFERFIKLSLLSLLFISPVTSIQSQQDSTVISEELIEYIFENSNLEDEEIDLYSLVEYYIDNPVNINRAEADELTMIPTLDFQTAARIVEHRNKFGKFKNLDEILLVENIDTQHLKRLFPLFTIKFSEKFSFSEIIANTKLQFRGRLIKDIQERKGFTDNSYQGNSYKIYNRLKTNYADRIGMAVLTEKDAGEKSYPDFISFNIWVNKIGPVNKLILGDYLIEHGQGLAVWSPYGFSKGRDAVSTANKKSRDISPYTSSDENRYFRGGAAQIEFADFNVTCFYSNNNIDAGYDTVYNKLTSLTEDGYHRTDGEILKKDRVKNITVGGKLSYNPEQNITFSFLYFNSKLSIPIIGRSTFGVEGDKFNFYSASFNYRSNEFLFVNEFAFNGTSIASINNLEIFIHPNFTLLASVRNYPRNFYNLYSNGFGEASNTQNEFGFYTGMKWKSPVGVFNFYFDQFKFPYATYYNPVPTSGYEFMIDYYSKPIRNVETKMSYKNEVKEMCEIINNKYEIVDQIKHNLRFEIKHRVSKQLTMRTSVEYVNLFRKMISHSEEGLLLFEDIKFQPINNLSVYCRLIFFQTDSYDTRLYQFENDLIGVMSNSPLYGEGTRWYILVKYKILNTLQLSLKYHEIYKPDERFLGSGLNEIEGNFDNRLSFQMDIKL